MCEARDGAEAPAVVNEHPVDLVLTGVNTPNLGGLELLGAVRQDPAWKNIRVVILATEGGERTVMLVGPAA